MKYDRETPKMPRECPRVIVEHPGGKYVSKFVHNSRAEMIHHFETPPPRSRHCDYPRGSYFTSIILHIQKLKKQ